MELKDKKENQTILATVRMTVSSERRDDVLQTIRWMLEPTRVERGCINFHFYQDIENENEFFLIQEWKSKADLDMYIRTDAYKNLLSLMELLREAPEIKFSTVSQTGGKEIIEAALGLS